ncbi:MAG: hypothetical protein V4760_07050 [Bdellovibrionota bacterium]
MLVTVILCVTSTIVFCACVRASMALTALRFQPQRINGSNFSVGARRVARNYAASCFALLAFVALVGAVRFYIELFHYQF